MTSQPRAGQNTQRRSTRRAHQNIQPTLKSEKLIKYYLLRIQTIPCEHYLQSLEQVEIIGQIGGFS